jgi:prepilin-type N-terminal cleavage/methylation domain-containing protein
MHMLRNHPRQISRHHGFTLVELAIVMTIIGLVIGGILGGQHLIRASEVRSILTDVDRYKTAINTFQGKYGGLPGDITNASTFFPGCASPATHCDGNGDGKLTVTYSGQLRPWQTGETGYRESWRAWQLLGLSGLIPGTYTGVDGPGGGRAVPGENSPRARLTEGTWWIYSAGQQSAGSYYEGFWPQFILIGKATTTLPYDPIVTPIEAEALDKKIDDGMPGTGSVAVLRAFANCSNQVAAATARYRTDITTPECAMMFVFGAQ